MFIDKQNKSRQKRTRGQIIIIMIFAMTGLIIAIGLVSDSILLYSQKQNLQRAMDSAVLAGSRKLPDTDEAVETVYEILNLHGFDFDPDTNPLTITFPVYDPPRKVLAVEGESIAELLIMKILGIQDVSISAYGEAESAPVDVYLSIDLSISMAMDTPKPAGWPAQAVGGCTNWYNWTCVIDYCNANRVCDPLDVYIKPAARFFVDQLSSDFDRIGVVKYDREGEAVHSLDSDFAAVKTAIDGLDVYRDIDMSTNIGDGILFAHQNMADEGRLDAIWAIVLLTDGQACVYRNCSGCPPDCSASACENLYDDCLGCTSSNNWATSNAFDTWNRHETVIYTIAYGSQFTGAGHETYKDLMVKIADITDNGTVEGITDNFWMTPDDAALYDALEEISERFFTRLLR
ncbi:MAG: VWA domain-containing protein [Anaerolineales bacterium]